MKKVSLLFAMLLLLGSSPSYAGDEIMPLARLKAGMKGYGKTVFRGTKVETFPVTILGVLKKFVADSDIILIRVDGGYPVEHGIGIIAGMSGSPIYVEGKLVGAIAYGWLFSKEPIGGVTPIESMLRELPPEAGVPAGGDATKAKSVKLGAVRALPRPIVAGGRRYTKVRIVDIPSTGAAPDGTMVLAPVSSPVQVSGFSRRGLNRLRKLLAPSGLDIASAPEGEGSGPVPEGVPDLVPGSAVGVQLLSGDFSIAGTGTLTYRNRDFFLAFGHPMMEMGKISLPFTASYIQDILPSYMRPFKLASQIRVVGEISQDRLFAVGGRIHASAPMIPVEFTVRDGERKIKRSFSMKSAVLPMLTPMIIASALEDAVSAVSSLNGEKSVRVTCALEFAGQEPVVVEDMKSGGATTAGVCGQLMSLLQDVSENEFAKIALKAVKVTAEVNSGRKEARIEKIFLNKAEFKPGETVELSVVLTPFGGGREVNTFRIPLPADAEGTLKAAVFGGSLAPLARKKLMLPEPEARTLSQFLHNLRTAERGFQLRLIATLPSKGGEIEGVRFPGIPESLAEVMGQSPQSDVTVDRDLLQLSIDTPWFVKNGEAFGLKVEKKKKEAGRDRRNQPEPEIAALALESQADSEITREDSSGGWIRETPASGRFRVKTYPASAPPKSPSDKPSRPQQPAKKEKPLGTSRLDVREEEQLARGKCSGTAVSSTGVVTLAPASSKVLESSDPFFWSSAYDPSRKILYLGRGNSGTILAVTQGGGSSVLATLDEVAPTAMIVTSSGDILVGASPKGRLYRVTPSGSVMLLRTFKESYIWRLLQDRSGAVYVATGNPGNLYQLLPSGNALLLFSSGQAHIRSLAEDAGGRLLLGTSERGVVYRASGPSKFEPLFDTGSSGVDGLAAGRDGTIWVAAGNSVTGLRENGRNVAATLPEKVILSLSFDGEGKLNAGTHPAGRIYRISSDGTWSRIFDIGTGEVSSLVDTGSFMWVVASNPCSLWKLERSLVPEGTYESEVIDGGSSTLWGSLRWIAEVPQRSSLAVQTRSGRTEVPDDQWGFWSLPYMNQRGEAVKSSPGRFLQYRLTLRAGGADVSPVFQGISFFYRALDQEPKVEWVTPDGGECLGGKVKLEWKARTPDSEGVSYDLHFSKDKGATWQSLIQGWRSKGEGEGASGQEGRSGQAVSWEWDTSKVADGEHLVRVTAYWYNPGGPDVTVKVSRPFLLCNTPPRIEIVSMEASKDRLLVKGFATSPLAVIYGITWRFDKEPPKPLLPVGGLYDSAREEFVLDIPLPKAAKVIEMKVTDEAGNTGSVSKELGIR